MLGTSFHGKTYRYPHLIFQDLYIIWEEYNLFKQLQDIPVVSSFYCCRWYSDDCHFMWLHKCICAEPHGVSLLEIPRSGLLGRAYLLRNLKDFVKLCKLEYFSLDPPFSWKKDKFRSLNIKLHLWPLEIWVQSIWKLNQRHTLQHWGSYTLNCSRKPGRYLKHFSVILYRVRQRVKSGYLGYLCSLEKVHRKLKQVYSSILIYGVLSKNYRKGFFHH